MKRGVGVLIFFFLSLDSPLAARTAHEVSQRLNRIRAQDVGEMEELRRVQAMAESLPLMSREESFVLIREISVEMSKLLEQLHSNDLSPDARLIAQARGRELISQTLAISVRSPGMFSKIEAWLEKNRKTYILLSEALVVAAAIIGAEIALKKDLSLVGLFAESFFWSVASIFAIILPARWAWFKRSQNHVDRLMSKLTTDSELLSAQDLAQVFGYPTRLLNCRFVVSHLKRQKDLSH